MSEVAQIEKLYAEIYSRTIHLHVCTVPFIWKPIDRNIWVVSVEIWEIYEEHITEELIPFVVDHDMFGVSDISLLGALEKYKNEFLPVLERFAKLVRGE